MNNIILGGGIFLILLVWGSILFHFLKDRWREKHTQHAQPQEDDPTEELFDRMTAVTDLLNDLPYTNEVSKHFEYISLLVAMIYKHLTQEQISRNDTIRQSLNLHIPLLCESIHTVYNLPQGFRNMTEIKKTQNKLIVSLYDALEEESGKSLEIVKTSMDRIQSLLEKSDKRNG